MGAEDLPLPLPLAAQGSQAGEHPSSPHPIPWAPPGRPWLDQQLEQSTTSFPSAPPNCVWQGPAAPRPSHRRHGKQQEIIIVMAAGFCVLPEPAPELSLLLIISSASSQRGGAALTGASAKRAPSLSEPSRCPLLPAHQTQGLRVLRPSGTSSTSKGTGISPGELDRNANAQAAAQTRWIFGRPGGGVVTSPPRGLTRTSPRMGLYHFRSLPKAPVSRLRSSRVHPTTLASSRPQRWPPSAEAPQRFSDWTFSSLDSAGACVFPPPGKLLSSASSQRVPPRPPDASV